MNDLFEFHEYAATCLVADRKMLYKSIIGTATFIANGIFITARHVAEHWITQHEGKLLENDYECSFEVDVLQQVRNKQLIIWRIHKIHLIGGSDLAIMVANKVNCSSQNEKATLDEFFNTNTKILIDLHEMKVGDRIVSLGYPGTKKFVKGETSRFETQLRKSEGILEDIHIDGGGIGKELRFQTNAQIDGGMSGGPVFNNRGGLFAINSSAILPSDDYPSYTSFVASIIPTMLYEIEVPLENDSLTKTNLIQLGKEGYLIIKGMEHFVETAHGLTYYPDINNCVKCKT